MALLRRAAPLRAPRRRGLHRRGVRREGIGCAVGLSKNGGNVDQDVDELGYNMIEPALS